MASNATKGFATVEDYLATVPPDPRAILQAIRARAKQAVPVARDCISYNMPALRDRKVFFFYAAFKSHIGIYPPATEDTALIARLEPWRGPKGNLSFPLSQDIPLDLIADTVLALWHQHHRPVK